MRGARVSYWVLILIFLGAPWAGAELSSATRDALDRNWKLCLVKKKGPFSANTCVCQDGRREMVRKVNGKLILPCGGAFAWCEAFRSDWGTALADRGVYVGNLFKRDLYEWDRVKDHGALIEGYSLEQFFIEANPGHKLDQLRAYGGLSGAEYEAPSLPKLLERRLASPDFRGSRDYPATFELLRRYWVRNDAKQITRVRNLSSAIQAARPAFKPYRDRTHNQISPPLVGRLKSYRDSLAAGDSLEPRVRELIEGVGTLVRVDDTLLIESTTAIGNEKLRARLEAEHEALAAASGARMSALGRIGAEARIAQAETRDAADRRRLLEVAVFATVLLNEELTQTPASKRPATEQAAARVAVVDASFAAGWLDEDERARFSRRARDGADVGFGRDLGDRVRENVVRAFGDHWPAWNHVAPSISGFPDDVLRASPAGRLSTSG